MGFSDSKNGLTVTTGYPNEQLAHLSSWLIMLSYS
jgi:hypothetical protein